MAPLVDADDRSAAVALEAQLPTTYPVADRIRDFSVRVADVDWLGHAKNAVFLQAMEVVLADHRDLI
ncbi:hypothetical protein ACIGKR_30335 [Rhodococcus qingshengii]|uniref:hypothetical protein n=1 Tax=Rhodococcus TaxID=1827 RepID=UPI0023E26D1E|nr:hypothetical protein [Rhodococcus sp. C3V]MDF3320155.1 hypothetical protein [Rhodococcus sp. C3V]